MTEVTLTYELLDRKNACECELDLFAEKFPNNISVSSEKEIVDIAKIYYRHFCVGWASRNLLFDEYKYDYQKTERKAYGKYNIIAQKALNDYRDKYTDKYIKVENQAYNEYLKTIAIAFARLYYKQESLK